MTCGSVRDPCLEEADPAVWGLLKKEEERQWHGIELIASENFTSRAVMEALGSAFTNKYSEGLPGARYYGGTEVIDSLETLTQERALKAYRLNKEEWGVNVQPYSGSVANFATFTALLKPHDRVMGLGLASGGHLSHGHYIGSRKINASSIYFESLPYHVNPDTGRVDYDELEKQAKLFMPQLLIAGGSAYPRDWDYDRMRLIADAVKATLLVDMAHYSGLVAGECVGNPFCFADVVTTTTHKSLRGPRAALIFFRKQYEKQINFAVFPTMQGGPHNNAIAGVCVQLGQVCTPAFKEYAQQVVRNCSSLASNLSKRGYKLVSGGTDTHLILWDLRPEGISGGKYDALCNAVCITLNKNSVYGDPSPFSPGGVRIGTPAMTSRGLVEADFDRVADLLVEALHLAKEIQSETGAKSLKSFVKALVGRPDVSALRDRVQTLSKTYFMPGFSTDRFE